MTDLVLSRFARRVAAPISWGLSLAGLLCPAVVVASVAASPVAGLAPGWFWFERPPPGLSALEGGANGLAQGLRREAQIIGEQLPPDAPIYLIGGLVVLVGLLIWGVQAWRQAQERKHTRALKPLDQRPVRVSTSARQKRLPPSASAAAQRSDPTEQPAGPARPELTTELDFSTLYRRAVSSPLPPSEERPEPQPSPRGPGLVDENDPMLTLPGDEADEPDEPDEAATIVRPAKPSGKGKPKRTKPSGSRSSPPNPPSPARNRAAPPAVGSSRAKAPAARQRIISPRRDHDQIPSLTIFESDGLPDAAASAGLPPIINLVLRFLATRPSPSELVGFRLASDYIRADGVASGLIARIRAANHHPARFRVFVDMALAETDVPQVRAFSRALGEAGIGLGIAAASPRNRLAVMVKMAACDMVWFDSTAVDKALASVKGTRELTRVVDSVHERGARVMLGTAQPKGLEQLYEARSKGLSWEYLYLPENS